MMQKDEGCFSKTERERDLQLFKRGRRSQSKERKRRKIKNKKLKKNGKLLLAEKSILSAKKKPPAAPSAASIGKDFMVPYDLHKIEFQRSEK